jgi:hypothetical protein
VALPDLLASRTNPAERTVGIAVVQARAVGGECIGMSCRTAKRASSDRPIGSEMPELRLRRIHARLRNPSFARLIFAPHYT